MARFFVPALFAAFRAFFAAGAAAVGAAYLLAFRLTLRDVMPLGGTGDGLGGLAGISAGLHWLRRERNGLGRLLRHLISSAYGVPAAPLTAAPAVPPEPPLES